MTYNSYSLQYYSFRKGKIGFTRTGFCFLDNANSHQALQLTVNSFRKQFFALQSLQLIVLQKKYLLLVDYQWMRNRNTIEFLGIWEQLFNPSFNPLEFEGFRMSQGQVNDIKNNTLADVTVTGH